MSLKSIEAISPSNAAIQYLVQRLKSPNYRGYHQSQHNRYDMDRVVVILSELYSKVGVNKLPIRTSDIGRRSALRESERDYSEFCQAVKLKIGSGTEDAMRKNYFVDFHRMGLLRRFSGDDEIGAFERRPVTHVALSEAGRALVTKTSILERRFIYSAAVDRLLKGIIDILVDVMTKVDTKKLGVFEFMFFVSAVGDGTDIEVSRDEAAALVMAYRSLSTNQRIALVDAVKAYATPSNFGGRKPNKKDFANWKNESAQVFSILGQTVYFEYRQSAGELVFATDADSPLTTVRLKRSLAEKQKYFSKHEESKAIGFELHHVVPLGSSTSLQHFVMLDDWRNLVYIDAKSHAVITQSGNKHVKMHANGSAIVLQDWANALPKVTLKKGENIRYSLRCQEVMVDYNVELNGV